MTKKTNPFTKVIEDILEHMSAATPGTEEYHELTRDLRENYELYREFEKPRVDINMVIAKVSDFGTALTLATFEGFGTRLMSKNGLGWLMKSRSN